MHIVLLQLGSFTLDNRRATRKIVVQQGLTLEPPLINPARNCPESFPPASDPSHPLSPVPSQFCSQSRPSSDDSLLNPTWKLKRVSRPSSPVLRSNTSTGSSLDKFIPHPFPRKITMSSMSTATVACHPGNKVALVLSDGITTPSMLLDWANTCKDFFANVKEPILDDKKVSKVSGGLQNSRITVYIRNNCARLHALTFPEFMSELQETFLPMDWQKVTLRKILAAWMSLDPSFDNFCTDIISSNNLLASGPLYLTEDHVREQIFNNMMEDLREKLEESQTELAALNVLSFQKWLNAISETNIKMAKAVKRSAKRVALELEKEEKKPHWPILHCKYRQ